MYSSISELKGFLGGDDLVIVGGGPSSENLGKEFTKSRVVLGCNYRQPQNRYDLHLLHDPLAIMWYKKNNVDLSTSHMILSQLITEVESHNGNREKFEHERQFALNPLHHRDVWVGDIPVNEYLNALTYEWESLGRKNKIYKASSPTPETTVSVGDVIGERWFNAGLWCIKLAQYFGAGRVFLSGFDGGQSHNYSHPPSSRIVTAKNRTRHDYIPYAHHMNDLKAEIDIFLVNTENSLYDLPKVFV